MMMKPKICVIFNTSMMIKATCTVMEIPLDCLINSLIYCFNHYVYTNQINHKRLCTVCIFLACKVEEYPLCINDLVNVVDILVSKPYLSINECVNTYKSIESNKSVWNPLIGSQYYKIKTKLLTDERELLKNIAWEVNSIPSKKILYDMFIASSKTNSTTLIALNLMNDIMIFSTALLRISLENTILACLVYATDVTHTRCISPEIDIIGNSMSKKRILDRYLILDSFFELIIRKIYRQEISCFNEQTQEAIVCLRNLFHK